MIGYVWADAHGRIYQLGAKTCSVGLAHLKTTKQIKCWTEEQKTQHSNDLEKVVVAHS